MTRLHYVKKARKSYPGANIKKGDGYYWWQFAFSRKQMSKTMPPRSVYATQSEHLGAIYDLEDEISKMSTGDIGEDTVDNIISQIEDIKSTCEERLDNIPDQLKDGSAGSTLQGYIDALESWISDLEGIDAEIDEEEIREEAEQQYNDKMESARPATLEDPEEEIDLDEIISGVREERLAEILDEVQNANSGL